MKPDWKPMVFSAVSRSHLNFLGEVFASGEGSCRLRLNGVAVTAEIVSHPARKAMEAVSNTGGYVIHCEWLSSSLTLALDVTALHTLLSDLLPFSEFQLMDSHIQRGIVEMCVAPWRKHLNKGTKSKLIIKSVQPTGEDFPLENSLTWRMAADKDGRQLGQLSVVCTNGSLTGLAAIFGESAAKPSSDILYGKLPVNLNAVLGDTVVGIQELKDLEVGDLIFCENVYLDDQKIKFCVGDSFSFTCSFSGLNASFDEVSDNA